MPEQPNRCRDFACLCNNLPDPRVRSAPWRILRHRLRPALLPALTCLALLLVLFLRRPEMFMNPQFWAEDGSIFFVQADQYGARALVMPYGGYHHLLLRLIAAAVSPLNAAALPAGYFCISMTITIILAAAFFSPRIDLSFRPACVLALGLIPHSGEVFGNLTNLQWLATLGLVWLLLARDATCARQNIRDSFLALVLGLTGVFSVLFAPCFLYRALRRRSPAGWLIAGLVGFAAAVQLCTFIQTGTATNAPGLPWDTLLAGKILGLRLVVALFLPPDWVAPLPDAMSVCLGLGGLVLLVVAACWSGRQRETRLLLVACCLLVLAGTLFRFRHDSAALDGTNGDRYFFLPKLLAAWLLIQGLANHDWRRWVCSAACLSLLVSSLFEWRYERLPDLNWAAYAHRIEAGESIPDIPINPGWTFFHPGRHRAPRWQRVPPIQTKP
jgi:hypothetical protein